MTLINQTTTQRLPRTRRDGRPSRRSTSWAAAIGLALAMTIAPSGAFALITDFPSWEIASEFNDSYNPDFANPSGVWSYGEKPSVYGAFSLMTVPYTDGSPTVLTSGWTNAAGYPVISHNVHAIPVNVSNQLYTVTLPPHALILHPGSQGQYATLRFTAPLPGTYKVSGQFYAADDNGGGTTTDVWIVRNNNANGAFSGTVDYPTGIRFASFTSRVYRLKAGQYLDFEVGYGSNGNINFDSTGLNAVIEKIN